MYIMMEKHPVSSISIYNLSTTASGTRRIYGYFNSYEGFLKVDLALSCLRFRPSSPLLANGSLDLQIQPV